MDLGRGEFGALGVGDIVDDLPDLLVHGLRQRETVFLFEHIGDAGEIAAFIFAAQQDIRRPALQRFRRRRAGSGADRGFLERRFDLGDMFRGLRLRRAH